MGLLLIVAVVSFIVVLVYRYVAGISHRNALADCLLTKMLNMRVDDVRVYYALYGQQLSDWQQEEIARWLEDNNAFRAQPVPEGVDHECKCSDGEDECIRKAVSVESSVQPRVSLK